jgi:hypothetical protein
VIPHFELEGGTVFLPSDTGLQFPISVTDNASAVGFRERARLIAYSGRNQTTVTTDLPIQVVRGPAITGKDWDELVRYIERNRGLLIGLWTGEIGRWDYMHRQSPVD